LDWLGDYHKIIQDMGKLNKKILAFEEKIDRSYKKPVSAFRRQLLRVRKLYAKADFILNDVYNEADSADSTSFHG